MVHYEKNRVLIIFFGFAAVSSVEAGPARDHVRRSEGSAWPVSWLLRWRVNYCVAVIQISPLQTPHLQCLRVLSLVRLDLNHILSLFLACSSAVARRTPPAVVSCHHLDQLQMSIASLLLSVRCLKSVAKVRVSNL